MLELLLNFVLFLVKTVTLVAAIIIVAAFVASLVGKAKKHEDHLEITHINEDYENLKDTLDQVLLEKSEYKKMLKAKKKADKKAEKEMTKELNKMDKELLDTKTIHNK